jgi:hypothetical protein
MQFLKGHTPWNKGKTGVYSDETRNRISSTNKMKGIMPPLNKGAKYEAHSQWKGDQVGYGALHAWVRKMLGKPTECENLMCKHSKKNKRFVWANISGEYERNISDWHSLCYSCNTTDAIPMADRFNNSLLKGGE